MNLSYSWTPHSESAGSRNRLSPIRNPLMDMLQAVRESGSIGAAAKSMQLSYRHVWGELKRWEQVLDQPLILWEKGQAARLSEFADKLLWAERQAQARLSPQISALQAELEKTFAVAFDANSHLLTVYASHDDALVRLREHAAEQALHLDMRFCGSVDALRSLNEGRCNVAGFHAPMQPSPRSLVARTYKPLLRTGQHKLIGFALRQQGLMVTPGNPRRIQQLSDLTQAGLRYINRSLGTGTRLLLDDALLSAGIAARQITGYDQEESSHAAVAAAVAAGVADAGLGIASAAQAQGLDFVPLMQECYWLVCLKSVLETPSVQAMTRVLQSDAWQQHMTTLPGYETTELAGQVQSLKKALPWWHFKTGHNTHTAY
nr:substrate-binding domain-containing protein [Limnohabitans sp. Jir72]